MPFVDDMVTGPLHHAVRPETAKVNARPPGEQKSGRRERGHSPVQRMAEVPELRFRVILVSAWKGK